MRTPRRETGQARREEGGFHDVCVCRVTTPLAGIGDILEKKPATS